MPAMARPPATDPYVGMVAVPAQAVETADTEANVPAVSAGPVTWVSRAGGGGLEGEVARGRGGDCAGGVSHLTLSWAATPLSGPPPGGHDALLDVPTTAYPIELREGARAFQSFRTTRTGCQS